MSNYKFNFKQQYSNILRQDFIRQATDMFGVDCYYLTMSDFSPSELDLVFQEVRNKNYTSVLKLRMMLDDVTLMGGGADLFSKFGLEIRNTITLHISRKDFYEQFTGIIVNVTDGMDNVTNVNIDDTKMASTISDFDKLTDNVKPKIDDLIFVDFFGGDFFRITHVESEDLISFSYRTEWKITCELYKPESNDTIDITETGYGDDNVAREFAKIINKIDDGVKDKAGIVVDPDETGFAPDTTNILNDNYAEAAKNTVKNTNEIDPFANW